MNIQNIFDLYKGRINRSTFFGGWLSMVVIAVVFIFIMLQVTDGFKSANLGLAIMPILILGSVWYFLMISFFVRRFHDTGHSGWWILLMLISIVNFIILLYLFIKKSEDKTNKYGSKPTKKYDFRRLFDIS